MLELRTYQRHGVDDIRAAYIKGYVAPLFVLPTGAGKTVIFCHIAEQTVRRNKTVLILVHRVELLRQTSAALKKSGVHHGLINPKYTADLMAPVQVASVQTLVKRLARVQTPDLIIIDEGHHATAGSWRKVIEHFSSSRVLGVTATPIRGDGKGLGVDAGGVFDSLIVGPQIIELMDLGFLARPIIYAPKVKIDFSGVKIVGGDYDKAQTEKIMDKSTITGDAVQHYKRICPGVPAVAFCVSVSHAEHVAEEFRSAGYNAYSVDGSMDDDTRSRILEGLGDGSIEVVTSCDLISEGTDIPAIECAILLRPTESLGLYLQQAGRALRVTATKKTAYILDHVGNVVKHGFPEDSRDWTLDGREQKDKVSGVHSSPRSKQCEKCFVVFKPAQYCPMCSHVNLVKVKETEEPVQVEGELEELTEEKKAEMKKANRMELGQAKTLEELQELGRKRGYKPGWAARLFNARQNK